MEILPFCYIVLNGITTDLTALCQPAPVPLVHPLEREPNEPEYVRHARATLTHPNATPREINTAQTLLLGWEIQKVEESRNNW